MLDLGHYVTIDDEPSYGAWYFDYDNIGTYDRIEGIRELNGKRHFKLEGEDRECWWTEDDLSFGDDENFVHHTYEIGDEVIYDGTVGTITEVVLYDDEPRYELDDAGPWIREDELKLHHAREVDTAYTLF